MPRALITGTGGYVGGRLAASLLARGWEVHGLSREPVPWLEIETEVLDLTTAERRALVEACRGADAVIHLAGENEVRAAQEPAAAMASTAVATERTAEAAAEAGVRRFVYMSTVHVYGERMADGVTLTEDMRPEPRASYAVSRLASEHLAAGVARDGFELVVLRLTNSVGAPYDPSVDRWTLVTNDLCRQGALDGALELRTSGIQWRDFVALDDVCSIIAAAAVADGTLPAGTYNLGSGEPITVRGLAEIIQSTFDRLTGERPELRAPPPEGEPPEPYRVSVELLERHGLHATSPLADAVEETVRFCLDHREELQR
jgi:UDP-glucose 4-epimerase